MALRTPLSVTPHLYMGDSTGRPLDKGVVYFGEQDKDPEFYPINLFSDDALTKPLAQPVHTKGGYLYDKGDMVEPHAKELIYSVKVLDSYGRKVFYKGAMMRNSWNDDVIEQINTAIIGSADIARQIATDMTNDAINNTAIKGGVLADTFVTATANAIGSVARTQRDVNSDFINVKDFGAKGLGEISRVQDTLGFKRAWDYCVSRGGGTIFVPKPVQWYALDAQYFKDGNNIDIIGEHSLIKAALPSTGAWSPLHFSNCSNLYITGLVVDGDYKERWRIAPAQRNTNNSNIVFHHSNNVEIVGNLFKNSGYNTGVFDTFGDGVYIGGKTSHSFNIHHNKFEDDGRWAVALTDGTHNFYINDNIIIRSGEHSKCLGFLDLEIGSGGSDAHTVRNIEVCRNNGKGNVGIYATQNLEYGFENMKIEDNFLDQVYTNGVQPTGLYSYGINLSRCKYLTVMNNTFLHAWKDAFVVDASMHFEVSNNKLKNVDYATNTTSGFLIRKCNSFKVDNNIADYAATLTLLDIRASSNYSVLSNTFYIRGRGISAIYTSNTGILTCLIADNTIYDLHTAKSDLLFHLGSAGDGGFDFINNTVYTANDSTGRVYSSGGLIKDNNCRINTVGGDWLGRNTCVNPDITHIRQDYYVKSLPTSGAFKVGDRLNKTTISSDNIYGWLCKTEGVASNTEWVTGVAKSVDNIVFFGANVYVAKTVGTTGTTSPTHTAGTISDGAVDWEYLGKKVQFVELKITVTS